MSDIVFIPSTMYMGDNFYYDVSVIILPSTYIIYEFSTDTIIQQIPKKSSKFYLDENSQSLFRIIDQRTQKAFIFLSPFRDQIKQEKTILQFILQSQQNKYYSIINIYNDKVIFQHQNGSEITYKASDIKLRLIDKKNEFAINGERYLVSELQAKRYLFTALKTLMFLEANKYEWQKYGVRNEEIEKELKISLSDSDESEKEEEVKESTASQQQSSVKQSKKKIIVKKKLSGSKTAQSASKDEEVTDDFTLSKNTNDGTNKTDGFKLQQIGSLQSVEQATSQYLQGNVQFDQQLKTNIVGEFSDTDPSQDSQLNNPGRIEQKSSLINDQQQPLRGFMSKFLEAQNNEQGQQGQDDNQQLLDSGNQQLVDQDEENDYINEETDELSQDDEFQNAVSYLRCPLIVYKYMEGKHKFHQVQMFIGREVNNKIIQIMWCKNLNKDLSINETEPISIRQWDSRFMDVISIKKNLKLDKPEDEPVRNALINIPNFMPKGNQIFELKSKINSRERLILAIENEYELFYDNLKILAMNFIFTSLPTIQIQYYYLISDPTEYKKNYKIIYTVYDLIKLKQEKQKRKLDIQLQRRIFDHAPVEQYGNNELVLSDLSLKDSNLKHLVLNSFEIYLFSLQIPYVIKLVKQNQKYYIYFKVDLDPTCFKQLISQFFNSDNIEIFQYDNKQFLQQKFLNASKYRRTGTYNIFQQLTINNIVCVIQGSYDQLTQFINYINMLVIYKFMKDTNYFIIIQPTFQQFQKVQQLAEMMNLSVVYQNQPPKQYALAISNSKEQQKTKVSNRKYVKQVQNIESNQDEEKSDNQLDVQEENEEENEEIEESSQNISRKHRQNKYFDDNLYVVMDCEAYYGKYISEITLVAIRNQKIIKIYHKLVKCFSKVYNDSAAKQCYYVYKKITAIPSPFTNKYKNDEYLKTQAIQSKTQLKHEVNQFISELKGNSQVIFLAKGIDLEKSVLTEILNQKFQIKEFITYYQQVTGKNENAFKTYFKQNAHNPERPKDYCKKQQAIISLQFRRLLIFMLDVQYKIQWLRLRISRTRLNFSLQMVYFGWVQGDKINQCKCLKDQIRNISKDTPKEEYLRITRQLNKNIKNFTQYDLNESCPIIYNHIMQYNINANNLLMILKCISRNLTIDPQSNSELSYLRNLVFRIKDLKLQRHNLRKVNSFFNKTVKAEFVTVDPEFYEVIIELGLYSLVQLLPSFEIQRIKYYNGNLADLFIQFQRYSILYEKTNDDDLKNKYEEICKFQIDSINNSIEYFVDSNIEQGQKGNIGFMLNIFKGLKLSENHLLLKLFDHKEIFDKFTYIVQQIGYYREKELTTEGDSYFVDDDDDEVNDNFNNNLRNSKNYSQIIDMFKLQQIPLLFLYFQQQGYINSQVLEENGLNRQFFYQYGQYVDYAIFNLRPILAQLLQFIQFLLINYTDKYNQKIDDQIKVLTQDDRKEQFEQFSFILQKTVYVPRDYQKFIYFIVSQILENLYFRNDYKDNKLAHQTFDKFYKIARQRFIQQIEQDKKDKRENNVKQNPEFIYDPFN